MKDEVFFFPLIFGIILDFKLPACSECLYAFFCVIPRCVNFICGRFGTLCLFHLHRKVGMKND